MWMMLQQDKPDDYVIATGETHTVREFLEVCFRACRPRSGRSTSRSIRATIGRPKWICSSATRPRRKRQLGWTPKTKFAELVRIMTDADIASLAHEMSGKNIRE